MFKKIVKKRKKKKNTQTLKYQTALEQNLIKAEKITDLQDKVIRLQEKITKLQKENLELKEGKK